MKKIISILFLVVTLVSCSDYLDEINKSNINAEEFYKTESGYQGLINSCYSTLRSVYGKNIYMNCLGTDMYREGKDESNSGLASYHQLTPNNGTVESFYKSMYNYIQLINTAIYYSDFREQTDYLSQVLAEIKFLRAQYYFLLVQNFGDVPLVTDYIDQIQTSFTRTPQEQVYQFVIKEMEEALKFVLEEAEKEGQVYKKAVKFFLSKVYLTRGYKSFGSDEDFKTALQLSNEVINGQPLGIKCHDLWYPGNENNDEVIFAVQYGVDIQATPTSGHNWHNYHKQYLGGSEVALMAPSSNKRVWVSDFVYGLYNEYDSRAEVYFMTTQYKTYYDFWWENDDLSNSEVKYFYKPPGFSLTDEEWIAEDSVNRKDALIFPFGFTDYADNFTMCMKKFDDPSSEFGGSSNTRDIMIARLAEAYLISAEAQIKLGKNADAKDNINVVRRRAAKEGHEADMEIDEADVSLDALLDERAREFVGERMRWLDLARTGKIIERCKLYNPDIKEWVDQGIDPFTGSEGELKLLRPIPQATIDLNIDSDMQQNAGYN